MKSKSRLLFMGGMVHVTINISSDWDAPPCYMPTNPSWMERNKGKLSKKTDANKQPLICSSMNPQI